MAILSGFVMVFLFSVWNLFFAGTIRDAYLHWCSKIEMGKITIIISKNITAICSIKDALSIQYLHIQNIDMNKYSEYISIRCSMP